MGYFYPKSEHHWRPTRPDDDPRALAHRLNEVTYVFERDASLATSRSMNGLTIARETIADPVGFADTLTQSYVQSLVNALRVALVLFSP